MQDKLLFNDTHNNNVLVLRRLHVAMAATVLGTILCATTLESLPTITTSQRVSMRPPSSPTSHVNTCTQVRSQMARGDSGSDTAAVLLCVT
jgi:hypothetical protein